MYVQGEQGHLKGTWTQEWQVNDEGCRCIQDGAHTVRNPKMVRMFRCGAVKFSKFSMQASMFRCGAVKIFQFFQCFDAGPKMVKVWDWQVDGVDYRTAFECNRHDEESSKMYYSSIYSKFNVVQSFVNRSRGGDHGDAFSQFFGNL